MGGPGLYGAIAIGLIAGLIAGRTIILGHGLLTGLAVGLVGALIGAFLGNVMGAGFSGWVSTLPYALVGAVVLLAMAGLTLADAKA